MFTKWECIVGIVFMIAAFAVIGFEKYQSSQCKEAYMNSNKTTQEIIQICGK